MKKIMIKKITVLLLAICFNTAFVKAQDVTNQTEQIKALPIGKYIIYDIKDYNGKTDYARLKMTAEMVEVAREQNFPEHSRFMFKISDLDAQQYIPTNMAFPATLAALYYEGNEKLQKKVGYVPIEKNESSTNRFVVVDGIIFDLNNKFNKDNPETFKPRRLYVPESFALEASKTDEKKDGKKKKKKLSFKERMKKLSGGGLGVDKGTEKLIDINAVQKAVDYLSAAIAQQEKVYPSWIEKSENSTRLEAVKKRLDLMYDAMNKYNEDLMDTPEYKRIQENNRRANAAAAKNNVTLKNDTGKDIYVYEAGSMNGSRINAGSSGSFSCSSNYYYAFNGNSGTRGGNAGPLAYSSNSSCGGTVSVK